MLSILIPVYNYDILPLVKELHNQAEACAITYEIIIIDDASTNKSTSQNDIIAFSNTSFYTLDTNIGRSAIRNLLASKANYDQLLFVDAGTFPKSKLFLKTYLDYLDHSVVIGGMHHKIKKPEQPFVLRWKYTKHRENTKNRIFSSANFMIKSAIIKTYPFDEYIKNYGFEDTVFFKTLDLNKVAITFVNNPVIHDAREDTISFIRKSELALQNLLALSAKYPTIFKDNNILKYESKLSKLKLNYLYIRLFKVFKKVLIGNFKSSNPSLILFDFYKLGYFCKIKQEA